MRTRRARCLRAALLIVAIAATCELAHADDHLAYTLEVDSDAPDTISFEALAARLASDLGAPVERPGVTAAAAAAARARITIRYRQAEKTIAVRAVHAGGQVLERSVSAEGDAAVVQREAILLAGNLARDEARELLDALAARASKKEASAAGAPEGAPDDSAASTSPSPSPSPDTTERDDEPPRPITLAVVYPLATNWGHPHAATYVDLSLVYGHVGRVEAFQLGAAAAHASRGVHGAQIAGAVTIAERPAGGAQIAGGAAIALDRFQGAQVSGGTNIVSGDVDGAQVTGGANIARDVAGAQITGVANVARDVSGAQIGIVNVGRKVHGLQFGIVNVAEEADAAVGLVSIARDSIHPIAWGGNLAYANAGIKFTSRYVYSVAAFSIGTLETDFDGYGGTLALGTHIPLPASFDVEIEGALSDIVRRGSADHNVAVHPRVLAGYAFAPRLRVFAGGGARIPTVFDVGNEKVRPEAVAGVQF